MTTTTKKTDARQPKKPHKVHAQLIVTMTVDLDYYGDFPADSPNGEYVMNHIVKDEMRLFFACQDNTLTKLPVIDGIESVFMAATRAKADGS